MIADLGHPRGTWLSIGFIRIECMVVVAIVGILRATAVPNLLGQQPKYWLNSAARQVMGHLLTVRMKVVRQNRRVQLFFSDDHQYNVDDDANRDTTVDDY
jgi:type II secretory pathway pseudopilin PulG